MHSSHLIADQFMGSGYKKSCNLIAASSQFNLGPMSIAEDEILAFIKKQPNLESFTMKVSVTWEALNTPAMIRKIKTMVGKEVEEDPKYEALNAMNAQDLENAINTNLAGHHVDLKRCANVRYIVTAVLENGSSVPFTPAPTGPDLWLGLFKPE
ncbi:hypothetical protein F8S13_25970 [Chloroflexia bacterium SDU3-3]|nr:hypothetical protein F8S13_25970 [Chloroflexia bacterium SDU3-3]